MDPYVYTYPHGHSHSHAHIQPVAIRLFHTNQELHRQPNGHSDCQPHADAQHHADVHRQPDDYGHAHHHQKLHRQRDVHRQPHPHDHLDHHPDGDTDADHQPDPHALDCLGDADALAYPCLDTPNEAATLMPRTESKKIVLSDASGGLNNRDLPGSLRSNQFSQLDGLYTDEGGFPGKQIPGGDVIQFAPIDPSQFSSDASTIGLWHLAESGPPFVDSGPSTRNLTRVGGTTQMPSVFTFGQKLTTPYPVGGSWNSGNTGSVLYAGVSNLLNGLSQVCFEAWINIDPNLSGQPITALLAGQSRTTSDDGAILVATASAGGAVIPGFLVNGITIHRDWDAVAGRHSSDPYFKFTLNNNGVPGTRTVIRSFGCPTSKELHVRGEYDAATGLVVLTVNGSIHATASVVGGGTINDSASPYLVVGGQAVAFYAPNSGLYQSVRGVISEARISTVTRTATDGFPFKKPRPSLGVLQRSDGITRLVTPAGDGIYATSGDGNWSAIKNGVSETAKWDWRQMGDILYGCNGEEAIAWDGDSFVPWGEGITPLTLTELGAGAAPLAGAYRYTYTYVYGAEETGPSTEEASITLVAPSNVIVSNIPTRHDNCSAIRIYRTAAGGNTFYLIREIANDPTEIFVSMAGPYVATGSPSPTTSTGSDGVTDASLGTGAYTEMTAEVEFTTIGNPAIMTENFDRLFLNDVDNPYIARWTEPGLPDIVFAASFVRARGNFKISALSKSTGEIQAHKDGRGCLVLRGDGPSNWRQLDNLHPTIGASDHFGIVYRTTSKQDGSGTDVTEVCIPTPEGWYGYQGYDFYRIDEDIDGTFKTLAQANSTKLELVTTSQAQFQAAAQSGGSASVNIQQSRYETDGLRQSPGEAEIVDQLDYIGLWSRAAALVPGKVIAITKADGEGCFYFATDYNNILYYTTDNFVTATPVGTTPLAAGERIIQIVRRGTVDDFWFCLTDSAGTDYSIGSTVVCKSSGGGKVYTWDNVAGSWNIGADTLFYDLDVPNRMTASAPNSGNGKSIGNGGPGFGGSAGSSLNIYNNHQQVMTFTRVTSSVFGLSSTAVIAINGNLTGVPTGTVNSSPIGLGSSVQNYNGAPEFYSFCTTNSVQTTMRVDYTRREYPRWRGGTFAPQAFWDDANSRLCFLASSSEVNGNRTTSIRTLDSGLSLATYTYAGKQISAIEPVGSELWMWTLETNTDGGTISYTFKGRIEKSTLAAPGTITATGPQQLNVITLRLSNNPSSPGTDYLALCKSFEGGLAGQNFYTYTGTLRKISVATSVPTTLLTLAADGDAGAEPVEVAIQTTTPFRWLVATQNLSGLLSEGAIYSVEPAIASASDVAVLVQEDYTGADADGPSTGIVSNLLFVPSSDAAGGYLWADRLYWGTKAEQDNDSRLVQHGIPGTWTVLGAFTGALNNLGDFDALGDFDTAYSGNISFGVANGSSSPFVAADFTPVTPNQRINIANTAPGPLVQWMADFTWDYSVAAPTETPSLEFVVIGYYVGDSSIPTVAAIHYKGRTRWSVARARSTENDLEIIYQKNNKWTTASDRRIISYAIFRGDLVCFEDYTLIRMEKAVAWNGRPVNWRAVTGYIMGSEQDKYIRDLQANVMEYQNPQFPTKQGWFVVTPIAAGVIIPNCGWFVPIPATAGIPYPKQVQGLMDPWTHGWARALALEFKVSEDNDDYAPSPLQTAHVQAILLDLRVSPERRIMSVD